MQTKTKIALALVVFALFAATGARASRGPPVVTDDLIKRIDPNVKKTYASALNPAMTAGSITTPPRVAAFLAQILHESASFQFLRELASGTAYEGRKDLGNTQSGDGVRYKGRGFIQLTGRANFRSAGSDLGIDLENNPDLAEQPGLRPGLCEPARHRPEPTCGAERPEVCLRGLLDPGAAPPGCSDLLAREQRTRAHRVLALAGVQLAGAALLLSLVFGVLFGVDLGAVGRISQRHGLWVFFVQFGGCSLRHGAR